MAAIQERRLIDKIKAYVYSADQTKSDELEALAREYAECCRSANERLTRCGDFLEQGLRTQAIDLAEAEPDLIEVVQVLSFDEIDEWQELVGNYGLTRFEALKTNIADAVSQAYDAEQKVLKLLKLHRRMAFAKAPIRQRLALLRKIAEVDRTATFWRDDIAEFETHRIAELIELGEQAARDGNEALLSQAVQEFESENWAGEIPEALGRQYGNLARQLRERFTLPRLANAIMQAQGQLDVAKLSKLRSQWDAIAVRLKQHHPGWQPPHQLQAAVYPAFQYLEQEKQNRQRAAFLQDVALLQQAIRTGAGEQQVDFLLAKAESHGFAIPPTVLAELREFKQGEQTSKILSVAVVVALMVAGVAAIVFVYMMYKGS